MLKKVVLFALLLLSVSAFCATTASEQIKGGARTWDADGTRLGMPGLANIRIRKRSEHTKDGDPCKK